MTPFWLDHVLVVVLTVFFPIRAATFGYRRLVLAPMESVADLRRTLYFQAIALQWGLSALMLALWLMRGRSAMALGLEPRDPRNLVWGLLGAAVIAAAFWIVRGRVRRDPEALEHVVEKLGHIERMLPRTTEEKRIFHVVALTAGVCEELLYRGYMIWYLTWWLDVVPAVIVSSVIFGVGHSYQGVKGIVTTTLVGAVMAMIYLASGSLWPAMAVHAIVDMHAGELAHAALNRPLPPAPDPTPSPASG
ncbi:MAG TPA: CPBP family glutamic-type intramembrane protease [Candidatus Eisenbacteria bacterium]|nr:CPBP family glutamic-type intramembrane protease [Candidatus Eisenbacteria bacterium]